MPLEPPIGVERALMRIVAGPIKAALCAVSARLYILDQNYHDILDEWEETIMPQGRSSDGDNGAIPAENDTDDSWSESENPDIDEEGSEEKFTHMSDVAAAARLKQLRNLKKESPQA